MNETKLEKMEATQHMAPQYMAPQEAASSSPPVASKNSTVAKNGFRAERAICSQEDIKKGFELYFNSPIKCITQIKGQKKSDIKIDFENGTETTTQNKDGEGTGFGWSVDRQKVEGFIDESLVTLLNTIILKKGTERPLVSDNISKKVLNRSMLGADEKEKPAYFTHTKSNKETGKIISMSICKTDDLMKFLYDKLYKEMKFERPKRTCVHLSPNIYLKRKAGGKKDHNPDDIQTMFRFTEDLEKVFTPIFPIPQTMPQ